MIGIFGGTFDPVHNGHLRVAQALTEALPFDELRLLPCGQPAHRAEPRASAEDRIAMLRLAIQGMPSLMIDEREVRRAGPSYMVDTLTSLREEQPDASLVLIIGWDAFLGLATWDRWQQLIELAHLLVVRRPGSDEVPGDKVATMLLHHQVDDVASLKSHPAGAILLQPLDALDVSSTAVRAALTQRQDVSGKLPAAVQAYIKEHNLYLK